MTTGLDNLKKVINESIAQSGDIVSLVEGINGMLASTHKSLVVCADTAVLAYDDFMVFNYRCENLDEIKTTGPRKNAGPVSFLELSCELLLCERKARHNKTLFTAFFITAKMHLDKGFDDIEKLIDFRQKVINAIGPMLEKNQQSIDELNVLETKIELFKKNIK
jgi:hypothetical protein